jgi:aspartate aminotransferase
VSAFFGRNGIHTAAEVAARLLREAEVVTVPGEAFGTAQHIRISYPTSPGEIDRGLERMRKLFAAL